MFTSYASLHTACAPDNAPNPAEPIKPASLGRYLSAPSFFDSVDTLFRPRYIRWQLLEHLSMVSKIQVGQLWKKDGSGETYLVTRVYTEALATLAVLRKSGAENEQMIRVRVERDGPGQKLPGFVPAQSEEHF